MKKQQFCINQKLNYLLNVLHQQKLINDPQKKKKKKEVKMDHFVFFNTDSANEYLFIHVCKNENK